MTPYEVGALFGVHPKTIARLAEPAVKGPAIFHPIRTAGGHRRYPTAEVQRVHAYLAGLPLTRAHASPCAIVRHRNT